MGKPKVILSVLNKKGGVGKTTVVTNMAQGLAILGKKVLVIDNDEQHNLSTSLGIKLRDCKRGLADVLSATSRSVNEVMAEAIYSSFLPNLHCVPGGRALDSVRSRPSALVDALETLVVDKCDYDVVLIDNAPTLSNNTVCAIKCSQVFLLPVQLRQYAMIGLSEMFRLLTGELSIESERVIILRNMYNDRVATQRIMSASIETTYPDNALKTIIPWDETFEKMVIESKSMFFSRTKSKAVLLFQDLICEIFNIPRNLMLSRFAKELKEYRNEIAKINLEKGRISSLSLSVPDEADQESEIGKKEELKNVV